MSRLLLLRIATLPFETLSGLRSEKCAASVEKLLYLEETLAREVAGLEDDLHAAAGSREQAADPDRARARLAVLRSRAATVTLTTGSSATSRASSRRSVSVSTRRAVPRRTELTTPDASRPAASGASATMPG